MPFLNNPAIPGDLPTTLNANVVGWKGKTPASLSANNEVRSLANLYKARNITVATPTSDGQLGADLRKVNNTTVANLSTGGRFGVDVQLWGGQSLPDFDDVATWRGTQPLPLDSNKRVQAITPQDGNVNQWRGGTPLALDNGKVQAVITHDDYSDVELWRGDQPLELENGKVQAVVDHNSSSDLETWKGDTPVDLVNGRVQVDVVAWDGTNVGATTATKFQSDLQTWKGSAPNGLTDGRVPAFGTLAVSIDNSTYYDESGPNSKQYHSNATSVNTWSSWDTLLNWPTTPFLIVGIEFGADRDGANTRLIQLGRVRAADHFTVRVQSGTNDVLQGRTYFVSGHYYTLDPPWYSAGGTDISWRWQTSHSSSLNYPPYVIASVIALDNTVTV